MTNLRNTLENAISDLDTAIERECLEDVGIIVAYMREALAKPDEPTAKPCKHGVIETADVGCRKCLALNRNGD